MCVCVCVCVCACVCASMCVCVCRCVCFLKTFSLSLLSLDDNGILEKILCIRFQLHPTNSSFPWFSSSSPGMFGIACFLFFSKMGLICAVLLFHIYPFIFQSLTLHILLSGLIFTSYMFITLCPLTMTYMSAHYIVCLDLVQNAGSPPGLRPMSPPTIV